MINVTKEPSDARKKILREEITEKFMEKIINMVNKNVQDALKKFLGTKNKEHEKTQRGLQQIPKLNKGYSKKRDI
jgi:5'-deoxynucleotidase YfbR-like HD superfamily hydrolase